VYRLGNACDRTDCRPHTGIRFGNLPDKVIVFALGLIITSGRLERNTRCTARLPTICCKPATPGRSIPGSAGWRFACALFSGLRCLVFFPLPDFRFVVTSSFLALGK